MTLNAILQCPPIDATVFPSTALRVGGGWLWKRSEDARATGREEGMGIDIMSADTCLYDAGSSSWALPSNRARQLPYVVHAKRRGWEAEWQSQANSTVATHHSTLGGYDSVFYTACIELPALVNQLQGCEGLYCIANVKVKATWQSSLLSFIECCLLHQADTRPSSNPT